MDLNCPSCGAQVPHNLKYAKLVVCPSCSAGLFLEDDAVRGAGERAALSVEPSLFQLGVPFEWRNGTYVPHGRIRFDYGRGFWDEWWVGSNAGEAVWMSVDEGDIAIESPLTLNGAAPAFESLQTGNTVKMGDTSLIVTERNSATCIGFEGELPEIIAPGDQHDYVHLSGPGGLLYTIEYADGETEVFKGQWIDPFEVKTLGT